MGELYLVHHGIDGQKWGQRNGPPYPLSPGEHSKAEIRAARKAQKKDTKWATKHEDKIRKKVTKATEKEMDQYLNYTLNTTQVYNADGSLSRTFLNAYNQKLSELMNQASSSIQAPSGKVVQWVAKRGDVGVYMALADAGYDMSQLEKGIWEDGRMAYKQSKVNMAR